MNVKPVRVIGPLAFRTAAQRWLGREDSNLRMAESKSAALPLGYAPTPKCEYRRRALPIAAPRSGDYIMRAPLRTLLKHGFQKSANGMDRLLLLSG